VETLVLHLISKTLVVLTQWRSQDPQADGALKKRGAGRGPLYTGKDV